MKAFTNSLTLVCFLLASFSALHVAGQNQMKTWVMPSNYYEQPSFTSNSLPTGTVTGQSYDGTDQSPAGFIYNSEGEIVLFNTQDGIYNQDGNAILSKGETAPVGSSFYYLNNNESLLGESKIIPKPGDCNKFYLIYFGGRYNTVQQGSLKFIEIDLSINRSSYSQITGEIVDVGTLYEKPLGGVTASFYQFAISQKQTDTDGGEYYHLYVYGPHISGTGAGSGHMKRFIINSSGINLDNTFHTNPYLIPSANSHTFISEGELYEDPEEGTAVFACQAGPGVIALFNMDANGDFTYNATTNPLEIDLTTTAIGGSTTDRIHGLEFSADGTKLYFTCSNDNNSSNLGYINYIDLSTTTPTVNKLNYSNSSYFKFGQIEKGYSSNGTYPLLISGYNSSTSSTILGKLDNSNNTSSTWSSTAYSVTNPGYSYGPTSSSYTIYSVPDQIDDQDYSEIVPLDYNQGSFTASTSDIWSPGSTNNPFGSTTGIVYIENELRIPKGIDIEIQDMDFRFGPQGIIIVEDGNGTLEGGELILTNTICQADDGICNSANTWKGIEVWGNPKQLNFGGLSGGSRRFGSILVQSSSQIKNAEIGILAASRQHAPTNNPKHGGLIEVESSSFINCKSGIVLHPHKYFNYSYIKDNTFTINDSYDHTAQPESHITLREVGRGFGIPITGNTLQDVRPTTVNTLNRAWGIYSLDSKFRVESCTLKTLRYGIYAVASIRTNTFFASNNFFDRSHRGIYARSIDYLTTIDNDFNLSTFSNGYGEYLDDCSLFEVQRNDFYNLGDGIISLGLIINNSNRTKLYDPNKISNNTFSDLYIGTLAFGLNDDGEGWDGEPGENPFDNDIGLHLLCGDYNRNTFDFFIPSGSSINDPQGYCAGDDQLPAGNTFSQTCSTSESDYYLGSGSAPQQTTYYNTRDAAQIPDCHSTKLDHYTNVPQNPCGWDVGQCNGDYYESLTGGRTKPDISAAISATDDSIQSYSDVEMKSMWRSHKTWLEARMINHYLVVDTSSTSLDSLTAYAIETQDFWAVANQSFILADTMTYDSYIDSVPGINDTIKSYYDSLAAYRLDSTYIEQIDSASILYFKDIAGDTMHDLNYMAKTVVQRAIDTFYTEEIILPVDTSSKFQPYQLLNDGFMIYPNPANDIIYLQWMNSEVTQPIAIELINLSGSTLQRITSIEDSTNWLSIALSDIPNGLYFVKVICMDGSVITKKIIVL